MQLTKYIKHMYRTILVGGALAPGIVHALGLGEISILSYLNEPLRAEIPVRIDSATEVEDLRVGLASQVFFDRFGIARSRLHDGIAFALEQRRGDWVIRVSSREPVREPHLSFPLEAVWGTGELIREYVLFVDLRPSARVAEVAPEPVHAAEPQSESKRSTTAIRESYGPVERGETLWPIAEQLRPQGVSTEQMVMALLGVNPSAFQGGNVNWLKAGAVLRIPTIEEINSRSQRQASQAFREQTQAWRKQMAAQYTTGRPVLGRGETNAAQTPAQLSREESELRILPKAQRKAVEAVTQKQVDTTSDVEKKLLLTLETTAATRLEFAALREQVRQMQEQMAQMRELWRLKEKQIAALESATMTPVTPPPLAIATPQSQPVPPPPRPEPRPVAVEQPVKSPIDTAHDFLLQWWFLLLAALLAMLGILLGYLVARRMSADTAAVAPAVGAGHTGAPARPYADEVARYTSLGAGPAAAPQPTGVAGRTEPLHHPGASPGHIATPSHSRVEPVRATASQRTELSSANQALNLGDLDLGAPNSTVSDDEIASWVKELEADKGPDEDLRGADLTAFRDAAVDMNLDAKVDDPLAGLRGGDEDADLEAVSVMQELLVDSDSRFEEDTAIGAFNGNDSDDDPEAVELKLELARAYIEIGDVDGARAILSEVVEDSLSGDQKEEATRLLKTLS